MKTITNSEIARADSELLAETVDLAGQSAGLMHELRIWPRMNLTSRKDIGVERVYEEGGVKFTFFFKGREVVRRVPLSDEGDHVEVLSEAFETLNDMIVDYFHGKLAEQGVDHG